MQHINAAPSIHSQKTNHDQMIIFIHFEHFHMIGHNVAVSTRYNIAFIQTTQLFIDIKRKMATRDGSIYPRPGKTSEDEFFQSLQTHETIVSY